MTRLVRHVGVVGLLCYWPLSRRGEPSTAGVMICRHNGEPHARPEQDPEPNPAAAPADDDGQEQPGPPEQGR